MFLARLILMAVAATIAYGVETAGPSEFYVVSVFFSDNGALFYYRVIDVQQEGSDSLIRYIRIAPTNNWCRNWTIVQSVTARVRSLRPSQLAKSNNPCAVKPESVDAALKKYRHTAGGFEAISFSIVTMCGRSSVTLALPVIEEVDLKRMGRAHPEIAHLWNLTAEITDPAFGSKDIFHDRTEEDELALQREGQKIVRELVSGRYDIGLAAAVRGNVGTWPSPNFRSLLEDYRGPVSETESKTSVVPQLVNAQTYKFSHFIPPKYPVLAMQARIQGKVELQLTLDQATGGVLGATVVSGHPLLVPSAIDVAKQWRFMPDASDQMVRVTLDFSLRCP
jgi:TonB family protein